ncbi:MAG TPA: type I DNA topoisomerase, partial [Acidimicrobiia bacterium]
MAKPLVIVESPTKARTIAGFLGRSSDLDATVMSSVGHVRDLPNKREQLPDDKRETHARLLGVNPEDHFDTIYVVPQNKKKVITELKRALKDADEVYLATDEDREGEAIAWHLLELLQPKVPVKRMVFHEITPAAIQAAIDEPRDLDMKLVEAQEGRRVLDRLVGYEVSPVLWRKIGRGAPSAGRVQSVAVRLVVDRERARMAFRSGSWFDLDGTFTAAEHAADHADAVGGFGATLSQLDGHRVAVGADFDAATGTLKEGLDVVRLDEAGATALADRLRDVAYRVQSIEAKPFTRRPYAPFTTSTFQQEAVRKLGFPASKAMAVAQRLYERGYITYMRTDSTNLSEQAITAARRAIQERYGDQYLPAEPRVYRKKVKNAQEAHEAIRPSGET